MTDEAAFTLDPRLAQDSFALGDLPLSRVLLMNDANYPWLILVPRRLRRPRPAIACLRANTGRGASMT